MYIYDCIDMSCTQQKDRKQFLEPRRSASDEIGHCTADAALDKQE